MAARRMGDLGRGEVACAVFGAAQPTCKYTLNQHLSLVNLKQRETQRISVVSGGKKTFGVVKAPFLINLDDQKGPRKTPETGSFCLLDLRCLWPLAASQKGSE